jgi:hypothetical protein
MSMALLHVKLQCWNLIPSREYACVKIFYIYTAIDLYSELVGAGSL